MLGHPECAARRLITASYPLTLLPAALDYHRAGKGVKLAVLP